MKVKNCSGIIHLDGSTLQNQRNSQVDHEPRSVDRPSAAQLQDYTARLRQEIARLRDRQRTLTETNNQESLLRQRLQRDQERLRELQSLPQQSTETDQEQVSSKYFAACKIQCTMLHVSNYVIC